MFYFLANHPLQAFLLLKTYMYVCILYIYTFFSYARSSLGGGGLKAFAVMFAKNVIFFGRLP